MKLTKQLKCEQSGVNPHDKRLVVDVLINVCQFDAGHRVFDHVGNPDGGMYTYQASARSGAVDIVAGQQYKLGTGDRLEQMDGIEECFDGVDLVVRSELQRRAERHAVIRLVHHLVCRQLV